MQSWFENIRCNRDLTCPHCNTAITDTSEVPSYDLDNRSDEISASIEIDIPTQMVQKYQNQLADYVALISNMENQGSKETPRVGSNHIASNQHQQIMHKRMDTGRVMLTFQDSDSD